MADITEIAVASWRLEKWLDNVNVERKMAAKSALRAIKKYLQENNIEVVDLTGSKFDVGLAVSVVNNESDETDEDKLLIREMVKPIIKENGAVIQYGQVVLGEEVKQQKENNPIEDADSKVVVDEAVTIAAAIEQPSAAPENEPFQRSDERSQNKKVLSKIAVACIIGLQIVVIVCIVLFFGKLGKAEQNDNLILQTIEAKEVPTTDLSTIENRLDTLEAEYASVVEQLEALGLSTDEILDYIESLKAKESASIPLENEAKTIEYTVKLGDTLYNICVANGIDYREKSAEILEINSIEDPNIIIVGQKIILPIN